MRPLCALGVSAETSAPVLAALDVTGELQLIAPGVSVVVFEAEAFVLALGSVGDAVFAAPFAFCCVPEAAFAAAVPAPAEPLDPPPPHAASTSDEDTNTYMSFID
jgi:hypothetical protein